MLFETKHALRFNIYSFIKRYLHRSNVLKAEKSSRRKYLSQMYLYLPNKLKGDGLSCISHDLFMHKEILYPLSSGAFTYLPLGMRALEKLVRIIDEEMQAVGAQKIAMPSMIKAKLWKRTGRWNNAELFKLKDRHSEEYCLGPTHEEVITNLMSKIGNISHKRLPIMLYQITKKFRDEMHPRYGLLRGREFEMKDLYTFDASEEHAIETYNTICDAYSTIFDRLQLKYVKVEGSTGNIGGKMSHEYHLPAPVGEDQIYVCDSCGYGSNKELLDPAGVATGPVACPKCNSAMSSMAGIEVGHTFLLGTKYSAVFNAQYSDTMNKKRLMEMGCYGLGVSRILQASVEVLCQEEKIRWPSLIAPYQICIIPQIEGYGYEEFVRHTEELSDTLTSLPNLRNEVLIDDRVNFTVGKRLNLADSQGYPYIIVVGKKCLEEPSLYEVIDIKIGNKEFLTREQVVDKFKQLETT